VKPLLLGFKTMMQDKDTIGADALAKALCAGAAALTAAQRDDGHWIYELEADATIPAEYILLAHFLGRLDPQQVALHRRMGNYLREIQEEHGGWPLFHRGAFDMSASVKAYYALKCVGDDIHAPHMIAARRAILAHGGAEKSNVFTRIQLALFGAVPWRAVPVMPVEVVLMPRWFPVHLDKIAYWSRTVIVPLLVLCVIKPLAKNPDGVTIDELFVTAPEKIRNWHTNHSGSWLVPVFRAIDGVLRAVEPFFPKKIRQRAIDASLAWVKERANGLDGLGAIYPAMANVVMMLRVLGYKDEDPQFSQALKAIDLMVVDDGARRAYCQPCVSPVWDTALAAHAAQEAALPPQSAQKACDWLAAKQVLDVVGDYAAQRPRARAGGWAFQYNNPHYPDVDDTAVVVMAMDRLDKERYRLAIERGAEWILGLQSKNGGWGAFDADNTHDYLNHIPFADHGALLDPPTADVSARCLSMLCQLGYGKKHPAVSAALAYLRSEQEPEGCWFGRWGTNYIYGTWSVLCALNAAAVSFDDPMLRRAVDWIVSKQQADGGWGESGASYWRAEPKGSGVPSTPAQTAWAVLGLIAAGEIGHKAVQAGIRYLVSTQKADGTWDEQFYTAVGFPRVFYLRYHGYKAYFPLWALARYAAMTGANVSRVATGM